MSSKHPVTLTIAGFDPSGGAGIVADIKSMSANGCYALSLITAQTAQNSVQFRAVSECEDGFLEEQFALLREDFEIGAVKIGLLGGKEMIERVASLLDSIDAPIVLDPVIAPTLGSAVLEEEAIETMRELLFPRLHLLTPNRLEAERLSGIKIVDLQSQKEASEAIPVSAILIKGGHIEAQEITDLLRVEDDFYPFTHPKRSFKNSHGTGCTLSSAIACRLAKGAPLIEAVEEGIDYTQQALLHAYDTGKGSGSLHHCYGLEMKR